MCLHVYPKRSRRSQSCWRDVMLQVHWCGQVTELISLERSLSSGAPGQFPLEKTIVEIYCSVVVLNAFAALCSWSWRCTLTVVYCLWLASYIAQLCTWQHETVESASHPIFVIYWDKVLRVYIIFWKSRGWFSKDFDNAPPPTCGSFSGGCRPENSKILISNHFLRYVTWIIQDMFWDLRNVFQMFRVYLRS